jgi:hypothetical protein
MMLRLATQIAFLATIFVSTATAHAQQWVYACDDRDAQTKYFKRSPEVRMDSDIYLLKVPNNFDADKVDVLATYKNISSQQKPTHRCNFFNEQRGDTQFEYYEEGRCTHLRSGNTTSVRRGSGIVIESDGQAKRVDLGSSFSWDYSFIQDANGNRINMNPYDSGFGRTSYLTSCKHNNNHCHVVRNCSSGLVETIRIYKAFPGYIILEKSIEAPYLNSFKSAPNIQF